MAPLVTRNGCGSVDRRPAMLIISATTGGIARIASTARMYNGDEAATQARSLKQQL